MSQCNLKGIQWKNVASLVEDSESIRIHTDEKVKALAASIKDSGIFVPVVVSKNIVVAGNARLRAAKLLKLTTVPVIDAGSLSKEQLDMYQIADNQFTIDAKWNLPVLKVKLENLRTAKFDLSNSGFKIPEIDAIIYKSEKIKVASSAEKEESLEVNDASLNIEPKVKLGDIWQLGEHFLICADSRDKQTYQHLLSGKKVVMTLTDPPFNVKVNSICGKGHIKHSDFAMASGEMSQDEFIEFLKVIIENIKENSVDGSLAYIFMDWKHSYELLTAGKLFSSLMNICIWNKMQGGMGSFYRSQHEMIFVYKNGQNKHINNIQLGKFGRNRTNVWDFKGVRVTNPENKDDLKFHPTCKPYKMLAEAILDATNPQDAVLDCFIGSGSTILACEIVQRVCYGVEIDPHYCDVAIYRWENLTGKKAQFVRNINDLNKEI